MIAMINDLFILEERPSRDEGTTITLFGLNNKNLKHVEIPYGVTYIYQGAFEKCTHIETVVIPETVTRIDDRAFLG